MINKYSSIVFCFIINSLFASEQIVFKEHDNVSTLQKGSLVVQYDKYNDTYNAYKEKISKLIDNEMILIKRILIDVPNIDPKKTYWDLYNVYWSEKGTDREPNENERTIIEDEHENS